MDQKIKSKLAQVLAKETERLKAVTEAAEKRDAAERERKERKVAAATLWTSVKQDIGVAVDEVNQQISKSGMNFTIEQGRKSEPALAQTLIVLSPSEASKQRQLVVNVSSYGHVQPILLIPHSGISPKSGFELHETSVDFWTELIVDFLDQAVAYSESKLRA